MGRTGGNGPPSGVSTARRPGATSGARARAGPSFTTCPELPNWSRACARSTWPQWRLRPPRRCRGCRRPSMGDSSAAGDDLLVDVSEGVATLTLNRPAQHNALSRTLREELAATLTRLAADDRVGVVVLTGAGDKAFCAGADLKEMEHAPLKPEELGPEAPLMRALRALRKPTIAAINGFALTGGFELAVNCDILVASTRARFADTHARVGLVSAWGLTQHLPRLIGPVRARYLSFTGNYLDAQTALAWGLVLDVVPRTPCATVATRSPTALEPASKKAWLSRAIWRAGAWRASMSPPSWHDAPRRCRAARCRPASRSRARDSSDPTIFRVRGADRLET